jgi:hypothetical protein
MEIRRHDEQTVAVAGLNLFLCELLHQIGVSAKVDQDDPRVRGRLHSSPSGGAEPDFDSDWTEFVEPGLRQLFQSSLDIVEEDLADFPPAEPSDFHTLLVPVKHLDAWLNALNQARLALAERYQISERDMESAPAGNDTRALALFQIHFYGLLQEWFVRELQR